MATQQGDIKFYYSSTLASNLGFADMDISGYDLVRDSGFETSVLIALFTDGRAADDDKLPDENGDRRGWWGDTLLDIPFRSKLWLLERAKLNSETLTLAEGYIKEALAFMITDGSADDIQAVATVGGVNQMNAAVSIIRKDDKSIFFKFFLNWQAQIFGGLD